MRFHWGHRCLVLAVVLCLVQYCISLVSFLDVEIAMGIWRTHHVFEMLGFFFLGLGVSKIAKNIILSQAVIWVAFFGEIVITVGYLARFMPLDSAGPVLFLLNLPMFVSFYSYKIYVEWHRIRRFGASLKRLDRAVPVLGLIVFQLGIQGLISLVIVEPSVLIFFARAIIFLNWLIVLFTTVFMSLMEIS